MALDRVTDQELTRVASAGIGNQTISERVERPVGSKQRVFRTDVGVRGRERMSVNRIVDCRGERRVVGTVSPVSVVGGGADGQRGESSKR